MLFPFFNCLLGLAIVFAAVGCSNDESSPPTTSSSGAAGNSQPKNETPAIESLANEAESSFQFVQLDGVDTGIDFQHVSGNSKQKPFPAANGSGVGIVDFDQDGLVDLCFANGTTFPIQPTTDSPTDVFYRNCGGVRFQNVSVESGFRDQGYGVAIATGDVDSDGFPDVYVTAFGENLLYLNQGDGTFRRLVIVSAGKFSTSAAFLDFDSDGFLDLYVCNYGKWSLAENPFCGDRDRDVRIFCSPKSLEPETDSLLQNAGDGTFVDVAGSTDLSNLKGRAQGVLATDVNADGRVDLYIGNDIHPNFLFTNTGNGNFEDQTEISGTAYDRSGQMQAGMGVAGGDVNRDGRWDLFVTNFEGEYNTLYIQNEFGDFHDVSNAIGLAAESTPWVGWGTAIRDFDLDQWKDLIVTSGHVDENLSEMGRDSPYDHPALIWKNESGRFHSVGQSSGEYFQSPHPGRGLATGDMDNDGDQDVVITHQDDHPALLRNDAVSADGSDKSSVRLRLIGRLSNRDAVGARVEVEAEGGRIIEQVENGGSYLSAHDSRLVIATKPGVPINMTIDWPSGKKSRVTDLKPSFQYDIVESVDSESGPFVYIHPD